MDEDNLQEAPMTPDPVEILLVEDNPDDAELALYALEKNKIANRVAVARDGVEALDYVFHQGSHTERHPEDLPKLILLDIKLPKMDGIEVLRALKKDPRSCSIPIVMLTSSREERDIMESYQLGVNSYIVKPVDFEQFTEAVQQIGMYWLILNERARPAPDG
jgi:two-component system response regulator